MGAVTESLEELAERVREALANYGSWRMQQPKRQAADAALATLLQRAKEAERDVRELEADPDRPTVTYAGDELESCEEKLYAAEARERKLREALEAIANDFVQKDWIVEHAREALRSLDSEGEA